MLNPTLSILYTFTSWISCRRSTGSSMNIKRFRMCSGAVQKLRNTVMVGRSS